MAKGGKENKTGDTSLTAFVSPKYRPLFIVVATLATITISEVFVSVGGKRNIEGREGYFRFYGRGAAPTINVSVERKEAAARLIDESRDHRRRLSRGRNATADEIASRYQNFIRNRIDSLVLHTRKKRKRRKRRKKDASQGTKKKVAKKQERDGTKVKEEPKENEVEMTKVKENSKTKIEEDENRKERKKGAEKKVRPEKFHEAHVYRPKTFPCESRNDTNPRGVYYVKIQKTNSTHWRDVALKSALHRSGVNLGKGRGKKANNRKCFVDATHIDVASSNLRFRDQRRSLLFTFVRDARDWKAAKYYFELANANETPSALDMADFVMKRDNGQSDFLRLLDSFEAYGPAYGAYEPRDVARTILEQYDFIGVVDDPDRSLVVFRLLFGLDPWDVLYIPSNLAGTIAYRKGKFSECQPVLQTYVYPEAEAVMSGDKWKSENAIDLALYDEAKSSLEATIDSLD